MTASTKKTARAAKAKPEVRERPKAADAMAGRGRMTFGEAYIRDVIAGVQRDFSKQLSHAVALGIDSKAKLAKLEGTELRDKLAAKLKKLPKAQQVWSATPEGEVIAMVG